MSQIDHVFGMDWGDARYVGDGVYLRDCTDYSGIPAVALRTDRENQHFVIVLEAEFFDYVVRTGQELLGEARANASKTKPTTLREVTRQRSGDDVLDVGGADIIRIGGPDTQQGDTD